MMTTSAVNASHLRWFAPWIADWHPLEREHVYRRVSERLKDYPPRLAMALALTEARDRPFLDDERPTVVFVVGHRAGTVTVDVLLDCNEPVPDAPRRRLLVLVHRTMARLNAAIAHALATSASHEKRRATEAAVMCVLKQVPSSELQYRAVFLWGMYGNA